MALSGIRTGALEYSSKKEFLGGDSLCYRETEVFNYTIYALGLNFTGVQSLVKNQFSGYSGDISVKVFDNNGGLQFPNDGIRASEFDISVEIRKAITGLSGQYNELNTSSYTGLGGTFFADNGRDLDGFSESFSLEKSTEGESSINHFVSFSLFSGGKTRAVQIASGIFAVDHLSAIPGLGHLNSALFQNEYTEAYDLVKNSFSFSKKQNTSSVEDSNSFISQVYKMELSEEGFVSVSEESTLAAKTTFENLLLDYATYGSQAQEYSRCSQMFNSLSGVFTTTGSLTNNRTKKTKSLDLPARQIRQSVSFSDNPFYKTLASYEETFEIDRASGPFINIVHSLAYKASETIGTGVMAAATGNMNDGFTSSPSSASSFYSSSPYYSASYPLLSNLKTTFILPERPKTYSQSKTYTNDPSYGASIHGVTFAKIGVDISDSRPLDMVTEYKIINRPSRSTAVSYAYQTDKGTKHVSVKAIYITSPQNRFTSGMVPPANVIEAMLKHGIDTISREFYNTAILAMTYFLSDVKYSYGSDGSVNLDFSVSYTTKKYT